MGNLCAEDKLPLIAIDSIDTNTQVIKCANQNKYKFINTYIKSIQNITPELSKYSPDIILYTKKNLVTEHICIYKKSINTAQYIEYGPEQTQIKNITINGFDENYVKEFNAFAKYYHNNGQLKKLIKIDDELNKHIFEYNEYNILIKDIFPDEAYPTRVKLFYPTGKLKLSFTINDKKINLKEYNILGNISYKITNNCYQFYNGRLTNQMILTKNLILYTEYYPNGNIKSESYITDVYKKQIEFTNTQTKQIIKINKYKRDSVPFNKPLQIQYDQSVKSNHYEIFMHFINFMFVDSEYDTILLN